MAIGVTVIISVLSILLAMEIAFISVCRMMTKHIFTGIIGYLIAMFIYWESYQWTGFIKITDAVSKSDLWIYGISVIVALICLHIGWAMIIHIIQNNVKHVNDPHTFVKGMNYWKFKGHHNDKY